MLMSVTVLSNLGVAQDEATNLEFIEPDVPRAYSGIESEESFPVYPQAPRPSVSIGGAHGVVIGGGYGLRIGGPWGVQFGGHQGARFGGDYGAQFGGGQGARFGGPNGVQFGGGHGVRIGPSAHPAHDPSLVAPVPVAEPTGPSREHALREPAVPMFHGVLVHHPADASAPVSFVVNGQEKSIGPGESIELSRDQGVMVRFPKRNGKYSFRKHIAPGSYQFRHSRRGWSLEAIPAATPVVADWAPALPPSRPPVTRPAWVPPRLELAEPPADATERPSEIEQLPEPPRVELTPPQSG